MSNTKTTSIPDLKKAFAKGKTPTEQNFAELIDASHNTLSRDISSQLAGKTADTLEATLGKSSEKLMTPSGTRQLIENHIATSSDYEKDTDVDQKIITNENERTQRIKLLTPPSIVKNAINDAKTQLTSTIQETQRLLNNAIITAKSTLLGGATSTYNTLQKLYTYLNTYFYTKLDADQRFFNKNTDKINSNQIDNNAVTKYKIQTGAVTHAKLDLAIQKEIDPEARAFFRLTKNQSLQSSSGNPNSISFWRKNFNTQEHITLTKVATIDSYTGTIHNEYTRYASIDLRQMVEVSKLLSGSIARESRLPNSNVYLYSKEIHVWRISWRRPGFLFYPTIESFNIAPNLSGLSSLVCLSRLESGRVHDNRGFLNGIVRNEWRITGAVVNSRNLGQFTVATNLTLHAITNSGSLLICLPAIVAGRYHFRNIGLFPFIDTDID